MSQTSLIAFYLIAGFLIYITVRNEWGVYYGFLAGTPTKTGGGFSLPGLGTTMPGIAIVPGTPAPDIPLMPDPY
jgi:hypothetical protein